MRRIPLLHPASLWGLLGVLAVLLSAVLRLAPRALDPLLGDAPLSPLHTVAYIGVALFMAYTEGYRGFQRAFAPRVVARAAALPDLRRWWLMLLAPLYCMGLIFATRRRLIVSWTLVIMITTFVLIVRGLDDPWRGIIDGGVVIGLSWGIVAIVVFAARAALGQPPDMPTDLPLEPATTGSEEGAPESP